MNDKELERIRQEKIRRLSSAPEKIPEEDAEAKLAGEVENLEAMVRARLSKEAGQRYANIKIAHPDFSLQVLIILARAIESGQIGSEIIDDAALKELLQKMNSLGKKEFSIQRK